MQIEPVRIDEAKAGDRILFSEPLSGPVTVHMIRNIRETEESFELELENKSVRFVDHGEYVVRIA